MLRQPTRVSAAHYYLASVVLVLSFAASITAQTPIANKAKLDSGPTASVEASLSPAADAASAPLPLPDTSAASIAAAAQPNAATATLHATPTQSPSPMPPCMRNISAEVVALPQPIMLNRLGASVPDALVFALRTDTLGGGSSIRLKDDKRPRPIALRANVGDCLTITFHNAIPSTNFTTTKVAGASTGTTEVSLHVQGMEWVTGPKDDGSFVGTNNSSLASAPGPSPLPSPMPPQSQTYQLYAREEGSFLLYTMGDTSTQGLQLERGLFGALNVEPQGAEWYRSQVTRDDLMLATKKDVNGKLQMTPDGHPIIDYTALYPAGHPRAGQPILAMLDKANNVVHSDLTAIITGPNAGRFEGSTGAKNPEPPCNAEGNPKLGPVNGKGDPLFCSNPAAPDRKQPYREVTIVYHEAMSAVTAQAFPIFADPTMSGTLAAGKDAFAINYGTGGIAAEVYANRVGVGPMGSCVDCKFEEFFLSAWSVGDPAMLVDRPANFILTQQPPLQPPLPPSPMPPTPPLTGPSPACSTANLEGNSTTAPFPKCANLRQVTATPLTGTVTFSNGSATVTGVGTKFKTEVVAGARLVLTGSPNIVRGTVAKTPISDTQLTLEAKAGANANGAYSGAEPYTLAGLNKATRAYYPDDPSNVYHSYINDHLKFRILHGGTGVSHVHHQHAHQWLQSPNSDESSYLDSQMISPGASYTLEMTYNGSGNRNKVVGDSIFHCHFYPHFASGMWAMWRTHDVFEVGSELKDGVPILGARALPDGEIQAGTPIPAIVPLPTIAMAPLPSSDPANPGNAFTTPSQVFIDHGQVVYGTPASRDPDGTKVAQNPGFPFFIPGFAGARPPHPPLDFACQTDASGKCMKDGSGNDILLDGGLPRHVITGGEVSYERHTTHDWSKDLDKVDAKKLPEEGTQVEIRAMQYHGRRCQNSFLPDGAASNCASAGGFILNGLPLGPQHGAPFADPAVNDNGDAINFDPATKTQTKRTYKAAAIQMNVTLNKPALGWHYQQQRMLTLWGDANDTLSNKRPPEPLFFRGNSGDIIEYWHTNLVPNYYIVDDFQVRTPTDILGQHIHLVKFDVTSSDGAGNGFNYEDGTFSPQEVQETIRAINHSATNGFVNDQNKPLTPTTPPAEIFDCAAHPGDPRCTICADNWTPASRPQCESWLGAQTTIQRWYLDPLVDDSGVDRTMRTVFTHDHFGPSTHQQAGLYAGLLIEPLGSKWRNSEDGSPMGGPTSAPPVRFDGGPTSWQADILTKDQAGADASYREFALEFQDFQLAYMSKKISDKAPAKYPGATPPSSNPSEGYINHAYSIGAPSTPTLISTGTIGTQTVNYKNEPIPYRVGGKGDLSEAFNSAITQPSGLVGMAGDPITPRLRAYQGDKVQIRLLVGAHMFAHQFNLEGPTWFSEPAWKNSGYRSVQAMGLSEHFELLFQVPSSSAVKPAGVPVRKCPDGMSEGNCADYLYSPSFDIYGISNGMWGLFRAYDPNKPTKKLTTLPNTPPIKEEYSTCPKDVLTRTFNITAVTAEKALAVTIPAPAKGKIIFNGRNPSNTLSAPSGIMYVRTEDLDNGKLRPGVPVEPLILRANAGDCIEVNLTNALAYGSDVFKTELPYAQPLGGQTTADKVAGKPLPKNTLPDVISVAPSYSVGLHPQLLAYDAPTSTGVNVGYNSDKQVSQVAKPGETVHYKWFAGKTTRLPDGTLERMPVEYGSLNLFPSDPMFQHFNGLFGAMVIEPAGSSWRCGEASSLGNCDPLLGAPPGAYPPKSRASATVTLADQKTSFREFVLMTSDDISISPSKSYGAKDSKGNRPVVDASPPNSSAVNYRTEPFSLRYAFNATRDYSCMLSNQLLSSEPVTPIFTAQPGDSVRFRMTHPFGLGTSQVFTVHGHVWQRNPYANSSREIGNNSLSQWLGSRDNHGSTDHFDLTIDKAGGEAKQTGDYLYTVFLPGQAQLGAWGIFRVGDPNKSMDPNARCKLIPPSSGPSTPYVLPKQDDLDMLIRKPIADPGKVKP